MLYHMMIEFEAFNQIQFCITGKTKKQTGKIQLPLQCVRQFSEQVQLSLLAGLLPISESTGIQNQVFQQAEERTEYPWTAPDQN